MSSTVFEINSIAICPFSKLIVYSLEFTLLELSAVKYTVLFIAVQEWLPIQYILENGIIKLKNNNYIKIIKKE